MVKRKFEPEAGKWDLPGGFVEHNESGEAASIREIMEELSIKIKAIKYFGSASDHYLFAGVRYVTLGLLYSAEAESDEIKAADDAAEAKYFKFSEIPWNEIGFRSVHDSLKKFVAEYETPSPGFYRHYKNHKIYKMIGVGKHSETLEDYVIYQPMYKGSPADYWMRPLEMFMEEVEWEGRKLKRFTYVGTKMP